MVPGGARLTDVERPTADRADEPSRPHLRVVQGGVTPDDAAATEADEVRIDPTDTLAKALIEEFGDRLLFLFHRKVPGQTGDLPVIAVTPAGVHLIEPRSYPGKRIRACRDGSSFVIDGVRHSRLAEQMHDHGEALQAAISMGPLPDAAVHTSYCFLDGHLPWRPLEVAGHPVLSLRRTLKRLRDSGPLDDRQVETLHRDLSLRLSRR